MSFAGFSFVCWRIFQIITLIPIVGMMAWFVDLYTDRLNQLTPDKILVLFIVSVLALAWAVGTLFLYSRAKHSAKFVAFVDLLFFGALIAAVVLLRHDGRRSCSSWRTSQFYINMGGYIGFADGFRLDVNRTCAMIKASWAFAIMNCIFFFITAILAWMHAGHLATRYERKHYSHSSRHGHRRRSTSHSRRSSHSHRQVYV